MIDIYNLLLIMVFQSLFRQLLMARMLDSSSHLWLWFRQANYIYLSRTKESDITHFYSKKFTLPKKLT
jgi:hypothetical protein